LAEVNPNFARPSRRQQPQSESKEGQETERRLPTTNQADNYKDDDDDDDSSKETEFEEGQETEQQLPATSPANGDNDDDDDSSKEAEFEEGQETEQQLPATSPANGDNDDDDDDSSKEAELDVSSNDSAPPPPSTTRSSQQRQQTTTEQDQEHRPSVLESYANHPLRKQFEDGEIEFKPTDYEFCCAQCRCKFVNDHNDNVDYNFIRSWPDGSFWGYNGMTLHRKCCHGNNKHTNAHWKDLSERYHFKDGHFQTVPHGSTSKHHPECVDHKAVLNWRRAKQDERDDAMIEDAPDVKHIGVWKALTHAQHEANQKQHDELRKAAGPKRQGGIVVLDCFAGQGTGLVALKKNGIRVKTYISVEHDKVAVHVSFALLFCSMLSTVV